MRSNENIKICRLHHSTNFIFFARLYKVSPAVLHRFSISLGVKLKKRIE